jgi:hypothetical protein
VLSLGVINVLADWESLANGDVGPVGNDDHMGGAGSWGSHAVLAGLSVGHVVGDHCADGGVEPVYPKLRVDPWLVTEPWLDA